MTVPGAYNQPSQATSALVWSIVGLVCCAPAAIVGFIQANKELEGITAGTRDPANQGTANAARIIAIIVGVLTILGILASIVLFAFGSGLAFLSDVS